MSTSHADGRDLSPGDTITFEAPSGQVRQGRLEAVNWEPQIHNHARYRLTVAVDGTTIAITPDDLVS